MENSIEPRGLENRPSWRCGPSRMTLSLALTTITIVMVSSVMSGCAITASYVEAEATYWGAFAQVIDGPLQPGINQLPASVRQGYCYRVIVASEGTEGAPQLRFAGSIDADSVGFPIMSIPSRGVAPGNGSLAIFGFCSQGTGTVQLLANLPTRGHASMFEASYNGLDQSHGPDVAAVQQWMVRRQQQEVQRRAQQQQRQRTEAMQRFAQSVSDELRGRLEGAIRPMGRFTTNIIDEVRSSPEMNESLVLEQGLCYVFGVLPHQNTQVRADVSFSRIRNVAQRSDAEGAILYSVCTAPSGPIQEANFVVQSRVAPGSPTPPAFAVRVANRSASAAERRAADLEWLRNDPEARVDQ